METWPTSWGGRYLGLVDGPGCISGLDSSVSGIGGSSFSSLENEAVVALEGAVEWAEDWTDDCIDMNDWSLRRLYRNMA